MLFWPDFGARFARGCDLYLVSCSDSYGLNPPGPPLLPPWPPPPCFFCLTASPAGIPATLARIHGCVRMLALSEMEPRERGKHSTQRRPPIDACEGRSNARSTPAKGQSCCVVTTRLPTWTDKSQGQEGTKALDRPQTGLPKRTRACPFRAQSTRHRNGTNVLSSLDRGRTIGHNKTAVRAHACPSSTKPSNHNTHQRKCSTINIRSSLTAALE